MRRLTVLSIALLLAGSEAAPAQESLCYRAQPKPAVRYAGGYGPRRPWTSPWVRRCWPQPTTSARARWVPGLTLTAVVGVATALLAALIAGIGN